MLFPPHLLLIGAVTLYVSIRFVYVIGRAIFSPLRKVPGPFLARFTDLWHLYQVYCGHFEQVNIDLHRKYGPIVRYGPNRYSIQNSGAVKIVAANGKEFLKPNRYRAFGSPIDHEWTFLADQNVKRHSTNRRYVNPMYALSTVRNYEPYVDECTEVFFERLTEMSLDKGTGVVFNMGRWFQCFAFDVIGKMTYAHRLGFLDRGEDVGGVMAKLESLVTHGALVGIYPFLHHYLFPLKNWWYGKRGTGRKYVVEFTKDQIRNRELTQKGPSPEDIDNSTAKDGRALDFLSKFWAKHVQSPETFTQYHVLACCSANMFSGSDTTAITLDAILYNMLRNPSTMEKLRNEVDEQQKQGLLSDRISFNQSLQMPYLQAVIKEGLRVHPPLGLPMERLAPPGGAVIAGQFFPEGTHCAINTWVEHRDPAVWGEDALEFKPERWLIADEEKLAEMNRHWIPFGIGSRTCFGRHIAFMEISKLCANLTRAFEFRLVNDKQWTTHNMLFVKPRDFMVQVKTRDWQNLAGTV